MKHPTPAQAHFIRILAQQLSAVASLDNPLQNANGYELQLAKLAQDRLRLKDVQSIARKIEVKRALLPDYVPWITGALEGGQGAQDEVLMTVMVWRIDTGDFKGALEIGRYAIAHKLVMPDQYKRTTACLFAEEIADTALKAVESQQAVDLESLLQVEELTRDQDMPDEVRAKLHKAIGYVMRALPPPAGLDALAQAAYERAKGQGALAQLQRALQLNERIGVKKDIERLEREIKNTATPEQVATPPSG